MGTIYPRGQKLWLGYKDTTGTWKYAPTPYRVGEEKQAKKAYEWLQVIHHFHTHLRQRYRVRGGYGLSRFSVPRSCLGSGRYTYR